MNSRYDKWLAQSLREIRSCPTPAFKIGQTVVFQVSGERPCKGTVAAIYASFNVVKNAGSIDDDWYDELSPEAILRKDEGPWYDVLCHEGGEVLIDEPKLKA